MSGLDAPIVELREGSPQDESSADNERGIAMSPSLFLVKSAWCTTESHSKLTRERFEEFLADTVQECDAVFPDDEPLYLIYDNARPHVRTQLPEGTNPLGNNIQEYQLVSSYSNKISFVEFMIGKAEKRSIRLLVFGVALFTSDFVG